MERKMQNRKKILSAIFFILLISILLSVLNTSEITWSPEDQLTTDPEIDWKPCGTHFLQATNETIWVVWTSNRTGNDEIFYKNSSDGGSTWSNDTQLTNYTESDDSPSIMQAANGSIWVVWTREIMEPYQWDLYYTTSNDDGATWSNDTRLTNDTNFDMAPSITQTANGTIWVVWQSDRIWVWDPHAGEDVPQDDLYYKISSDDGATWSNDTRLTTDLKLDVGPSIIQTSNDKIWVTWSSDRHDGFEIFYKTYNGTTWSNEFQLTEHVSNDWGPSITQCNGTIWIVWHSRRDGNYDIYYTTSDDDGANWSYDRRITTDTGVDVTPSITQIADSEIWIFFASNRAGNYDIWYKTAIGASPSADMDRNGVVEAFDFIKFIGSYGLSSGDEGYNPNADYDVDGDVDDDDFTIFYLYYYDSIT